MKINKEIDRDKCNHDWSIFLEANNNNGVSKDTLYKCKKCELTIKATEKAFLGILNEIKHWSKWIPIVVSILALIISIVALFIKNN